MMESMGVMVGQQVNPRVSKNVTGILGFIGKSDQQVKSDPAPLLCPGPVSSHDEEVGASLCSHCDTNSLHAGSKGKASLFSWLFLGVLPF